MTKLSLKTLHSLHVAASFIFMKKKQP